MADPLDALRASSEHLREIVERLDAGQLEQPAYPAQWNIAEVLSHLGSGAVIFQQHLQCSLTGTAMQPDFSQSVWDEWNAKASVTKATDALAADREFTNSLASVTDDDRRRFSFEMGPIKEDFAGFIALRLNEHALHTWDIEVAVDPAATLLADATDVVVDRLQLIVRFTGKPSDERRLSIRTNGPRRDFTLVLDPDTVLLEPTGPIGEPDVELPAEALIRLVYGRLDPGHTPVLHGTEHLDTLRHTFPGP
jgi:uncharacterized protein (TIGR03083 family)